MGGIKKSDASVRACEGVIRLFQKEEEIMILQEEEESKRPEADQRGTHTRPGTRTHTDTGTRTRTHATADGFASS